MNWKEQFNEIEKNFGKKNHDNWNYTYTLIVSLTEEKPDNVELYVRSLYIIHNIILEEQCSDNLQVKMEDLLKNIFLESRTRFSENTEYLFFIGKILFIAEWYWGLEDNKTAFAFQKKAMELDPENVLFEWAYRFSLIGDPLSGYLSYQILNYDKSSISWLKTKGFPGSYILSHLESDCREYIESKIEK